MGTDTPRAALNRDEIANKVSRYWRVSVVDVTGSTQEDLIARVQSGSAMPGEVLAAEFQSAGRGRLDRTFSAEISTALTFSIYIEPEREMKDWSFIPLLAGVAVAQSLNNYLSGAEIKLKWPNDLMIGEEKLGGIIAQASGDGVVLGIGINVQAGKEELPVSHATSLLLHGASELDRNILLGSVLNCLEDLFSSWNQGGDLRDDYRRNSSTLNRMITAELPGGGKSTGIAHDISESGELILDSGAHISVGDIVHLR